MLLVFVEEIFFIFFFYYIIGFLVKLLFIGWYCDYEFFGIQGKLQEGCGSFWGRYGGDFVSLCNWVIVEEINEVQFGWIFLILYEMKVVEYFSQILFII